MSDGIAGWGIAQFRVTLFPKPDAQRAVAAVDLWSYLYPETKPANDASISAPAVARIQSGTAKFGVVSTHVQAERLDIIWAPAPTASDSFPVISDIDPAITEAINVGSQAAAKIPFLLDRLAIGCVFALPESDDAVRVMKQYLPTLPIEAGDTEISFQRNRRLKGPIAGQETDINVGVRWSTSPVQFINAAQPTKISKVLTLPQFELDVNTAPERMLELQGNAAAEAFVHLAKVFREQIEPNLRNSE